MRTVPLRDRVQVYAEYGDGLAASPAIVMVHGLRGTWQGLDRVARALCSQYRVIIPALPGFGDQPDLTAGNTVAGYVQWLDEFVTALDIPAVHLFGHSFGSIIAAASAGMPLRSLTLMNPVAVSSDRGPHPVLSRFASALYSAAGIVPHGMGTWLLTNRLHVRGMSVAMVRTHDRALRRWIHLQHDTYYNSYTSLPGVIDAFRESAHRSVSDYVGRIRVPTLLIAGDMDDIATVAQERELCLRIPGARLEVIHGVGHLIHYERPAEAAGIIRRFLSAQDAAQ